MILKVIILGIIEGLTEFLPISSTGHLIIANKFIEFTGEFANMFDIVIQVGAIFAVVIYFRDKIFPNFKEKEQLKEKFYLWLKILVAFIPAAILGVLFNDKIEYYLFKPTPVAIALIVGGIFLVIAELVCKSPKIESEKNITIFTALIVGFAQCFSLWPGMSRSASTIIGGLFVGFSRSIAAEFSFLLSIPTIMGASCYRLIKSKFVFSSYELFLLLLGTLIAFIVAYFVVALFMKFIKTNKLYPFAAYRIILALVVLVVL